MQGIETGESALRRLFSALVEQTFQADLGIADPSLTDYLSGLLCRFVRFDVLFKVRDTGGRRLEEVAEMIAEAEVREGRPRREIYRHIGDFTLFWSGVYPEALPKLRSERRMDHLLDYCEHGKRSYLIASSYADGPFEKEAPTLRRLSDEFELCGAGLNRVRREWEAMAERTRRTGWDARRN